jgi:hypothetical protein
MNFPQVELAIRDFAKKAQDGRSRSTICAAAPSRSPTAAFLDR